LENLKGGVSLGKGGERDDSINMDFKNFSSDSVERIHLVQNRVQCRAGLNLWASQKRGDFLIYYLLEKKHFAL
jgi:hypothetical protein